MKLGVIFVIILTATVGLSAASGLEAYRVELSTRLDRLDVPLDRQVRLLVEVSWQGSAGEVEILDVSRPELHNLQQVGNAVSVRQASGESGPQTVRTLTYALRPQAQGMAYVEPIYLKYRTGGGESVTLSTRRVELLVTGPAGSLGELRPIHWAGIALLIILLAGGTAGLIRRTRNRKPAEPVILETPRPGEEALSELTRMIDRPEGKENVETASEAARIIFTYLGEALFSGEVPATTAAVMVQAADRLQSETARALSGILDRLDRIRFGGESVSGEEMKGVLAEIRGLVGQIDAESERSSEANKNDHES
jgi:hypothetical protein